MLGAGSCPSAVSGRSSGAALIASSSGTVANMPTPQTASAQPAPNSATHSPASAAPAIMAAFIVSLLIALASRICSAVTSRGSSAIEAG